MAHKNSTNDQISKLFSHTASLENLRHNLSNETYENMKTGIGVSQHNLVVEASDSDHNLFKNQPKQRVIKE